MFQVEVAIIYLRVTLAAVHQAPSICWMAKRAPLAFVLDENDSGAIPGSVRTSTGSTLNIGTNRWKASSLFKRCPVSRFRAGRARSCSLDSSELFISLNCLFDHERSWTPGA